MNAPRSPLSRLRSVLGFRGAELSAAFDGTGAPSGGIGARSVSNRGLFGLACLTLLGLAAFLGSGVPSAGAADDLCPNAAFRNTAAEQRLPNCRAYEKVSPLDKNGGETDRHARSSQSGDAVWYLSDAAFAGTASNAFGGSYLADRQADSWSTVGINAPINPNFGVHPPTVRGVSEDHRRVVVSTNVQLTPDAWEPSFFVILYGEALYLRDQADGSYELLTPEPLGGWTWEEENTGTEQATPYPSLFGGGDADFSHVLFETPAELTPESTPLADGAMKLYLYADGQLSLASVDQNGDPLPGSAGSSRSFSESGEAVFPWEPTPNGVISADGSRIFFTSPASGPGGGPGALYVRENDASTLIDPSAVFRGATPDGANVFFSAEGTLKRYDVDSDTTTVLSVDSEPADGSSPSVLGVLGFGDDGKTIYFVAGSQLVAGGPTGASSYYFYVWDDGTVKHLGSPLMSDFAWSDHPSEAQKYRSVSADGSALLFHTNSVLTAIPTTGSQLYRYDSQASTPLSPQFDCISCYPDGSGGGGVLPFESQQPFKPRRYLSDDGDRAFFVSTAKLLPDDTNSAADVYLWEDDQLKLISTGSNQWPSRFADASATGDDVFFTTYEPLVGADRDDNADLYDARVGGGLLEPTPPLRCQGEECRGDTSLSPELTGAGTAALHGLGNLRLGRQVNRRCAKLGRQARALSARANRLSHRAAQVRNPRRATRLRRRARRLSQGEKRRRAQAKRCTHRQRRADR